MRQRAGAHSRSARPGGNQHQGHGKFLNRGRWRDAPVISLSQTLHCIQTWATWPKPPSSAHQRSLGRAGELRRAAHRPYSSRRPRAQPWITALCRRNGVDALASIFSDGQRVRRRRPPVYWRSRAAAPGQPAPGPGASLGQPGGRRRLQTGELQGRQQARIAGLPRLRCSAVRPRWGPPRGRRSKDDLSRR